MSVNDGLSDEEWGAWGKSTGPIDTLKTGVSENNTNVSNGFASDNEVTFNAESSTSKFSNSFNTEQNSNGRFNERKGGFNSNRGGNNNRFGSKRENNETENKFKSNFNNDNYKNNGYGNDRYKNKDNQSDYKRNGYEEKNGHYNNNYEDSRENGNRFNRKDEYRRDNSRENDRRNDRRNDSVERRNNQNGKRNDYIDRRNDRDDRRDHYKRDDSRENRNNYRRREDSFENDRNGYRRSDRKDNYGRDDSRENRSSYRNKRNGEHERSNSRERRNYRRKEDFDDDNYGESKSRRFNRRDDSREKNFNKRDDSRENRKQYNRREDSRENRKYKREDSRENRKYNKREDSRENRKQYNKRDDFKRDDSRENRKQFNKREDSRESRNGFGRGRVSRNNGRDDDDNDRCNERNRNSYRNNSYEDDFRGKNQSNHRDRGENNAYNKMSDEFEQNVKIDDDNERFSSRTFVRGQKTSSENDNNKPGEDSAAPVVKRATFIPDDDQEDYELHVNCGINFDNYEKIPVEVTGEEVPGAINSFAGLNLPEFLVANIESLKYSKLTPVQKYAIPIIDSHRDLMACAQTGSGKTAAFLIPIIKSINEELGSEDSPTSAVAFPKALIMAPTRELCRQIFTAARQLCRESRVKCAYIYGGIEMNKSRRNIQATGCDILVATPGRLIHFLELVWISLKHLRYFVLDEADRMLEAEGFYESVNKIYVDTANYNEDGNKTLQISMFSATFPNEIQTLARNLLKNYLFLAVGVVGSANCDVKQEIIQSDQREKVNTAIEYIKTIPDEKTLIFVESKRMADFFGIKLGYLGFKATTIHGDREQEQREVALNDFKSGRANFMVATNVAARGLDIPKVDNVINIDMPGDIDTYVHRIGRTGRCGNVGRAISFFDDTKDIALAQPLVSKLEEANQECPDWLRALCSGNNAVRKSAYSRDTRKDVKTSKYIDNPTDDGFMKGTNIDYDDVKPSSEWLED